MQPFNDYEEYFDTSEDQEIRHQAQGLGFTLSMLWLVFIYLPLLTIGYIASFQILSPKDSAFTWIGSILFFAGVTYGIVQLLKQKIQTLRANDHPAWIPLFIFCVVLTCVQTPWIAYYPISHLCERCHWPHSVAWALDIGLGLAIYRRYDFLAE
jgi:hypothetical protein